MSYKAAIRKATPKLYSLAMRLRHSGLVSRIESLRRYRVVSAEQAANRGYLAINIQGRMGFAAMLSQLIAALLYCEAKRLRAVIRFTNPLYTNAHDRHYNWFEDFFEYIEHIPAQTLQRLKFSDVDGQSDYNRRRLDDDISLERAHELYQSYFRIRSDVLAEARQFESQCFAGHVLAIHYRGTDKKYESPLVQFDRMDQFIERVISAIGAEGATEFKVFLATDDNGFLQHMRRGRFAARLLVFDCREVSVDGNPIHFSPGDSHRKGLEALSTIYLLSRCSWCIKTTSQLSAWAKILNPALKVYIPQRSFSDSFHFPDKQLWEARERLD